jgi:putative peptidoglycan lipid II flippase
VVFETARLSIPRTLALSIVSFVSFFFAALASKLDPGSIAIFNLSLNLQSVPLSLIGVSFSLAAFPALSISAAKKDTEEVIAKISDGLRQIIFWSLPFTALIIVLRAHIVRVVLGSGSFDWAATRLVAASLSVFVVSAVFQSLQLFLSRSHYALGKTKWPLVGNILGGVVSIIFALAFFGHFAKFKIIFNLIADFLNVSDLSFEILLLPLAYSIGAFVSAVVLFLALDGNLVGRVWRQIRSSILAGLLTAIVSGIGSYATLSFLDGFFNLNSFIGVLSH